MRITLFLVAAIVLSTICATHADTVTLVAVDAKLNQPFGVEFDSQGRLLIIEYTHRLLAISTDGKLTTLAGDGTKGDAGDGGAAKSARFASPHSLAVGGDGAIYVADSLNHRIRRIDQASGNITTFAGTTKGYSGDDGPADKAQFSGIYCIAFNPDKSKMIVTDLDNRRIRVIDMASKEVSLLAGDGTKGVPTDGSIATSAALFDPRAADMDSRGNVYILERNGHALRVVDPAGKIRTLIPGPTDRNAPKTLAGPKHLCVDSHDDVLIADTDNHRIVKWQAAEGRMTVLTTGGKGTAGIAGPLEKLQLNQPHGVYLDSRGVLYISDSMNNRVLRIDLDRHAQ
jgi:sugar lactone lactonase YvrE